MGLHSSPTGELRLDDVEVTPDRLLEGSEHESNRRRQDRRQSASGAKATFAMERASMAANALGIIERCLELSLDYARTRVQFGQPIGDYQLIQLKLAKMEVARINTETMLLQYIAMSDAGIRPSSPRPRRSSSTPRRRHGGDARGGPDLRWQRLHVREPRRTTVPRRQDSADLRRNRRIQVRAIARDLLSHGSTGALSGRP